MHNGIGGEVWIVVVKRLVLKSLEKINMNPKRQKNSRAHDEREHVKLCSSKVLVDLLDQ